MYTMDIDLKNRNDWEKRRKIRIVQVRNQSKEISKKIRDSVFYSTKNEYEDLEIERYQNEQKYKSLILNKLKSDFSYLIQDIGNGYSLASEEGNPNIQLAEKRLINRYKALSRGVEAKKKQDHMMENIKMDLEMKEKKAHYIKTVEKIRSSLITSVPKVGYDVDLKNNKKNRCILIQSQTILDESSISDYSSMKSNISKPWSRSINKENEEPNNLKSKLDIEPEKNKETVFKFTQLEKNIEMYKTLVDQLKKLSSEEQEICCKTQNILSANLKNDSKEIKNQYEDMQNKHVSDSSKVNCARKCMENMDLNDLKLNSSICSLKKIDKCINEKNNLVEFPDRHEKHLKVIQNTQKKKIPLANIKSMLDHIDTKKKKLSDELYKNLKYPTKSAKIQRICTSIKPTNTASLPNKSTINIDKHTTSSKSKTMVKQNSKEKNKNDLLNYKPNIDNDLMRYINMLLKMSPSDVANLSISTSSNSSDISGKSVLNESNDNLEYYKKLHNEIFKLTKEVPNISKDIDLDSPNNIRVLNCLQKITECYIEPTKELKHICEESPQDLSEISIISTNNKIQNISQESPKYSSSIDENCILEHLSTLLKEKGLIQPNYDWPMFETSNNDDDKSLTDLLLAVNPVKSFCK
ncbi:uncharacterized protein LOC126908023 isoform X2 [Daktulosphaira vitifoliae]|nr:uncharacterized protein LOC126908023 isoform X2 [Daktulosphaira vitifoliae]XP_050545793.1 uncharacterized protein LOC126908023 isoform X2 [Daktulosphaira vitifoliae]XP_050545794.1 uncharacterized protein LOC126908023 isoform X2 [Daktulosphaira vitifoliae]